MGRHRSSINPAEISQKALARFRSFLDFDGECVVWLGSVEHGTGYGVFYVNRISVTVHRLAWMLAHGPIPGELMIRHRCPKHNKLCILHLDIGTAKDNSHDTIEDRKLGLVPPHSQGPRPTTQLFYR